MDVKNKICEGKKKNCNKCDRKLFLGDNFCGTCGTKIEDEDDHEGGNDGRDDEDRPEQKTKKQRIETIENTTQKSIFKGDEPEKRCLAVVCSHSKFIHPGLKLGDRDSASEDCKMMKSLWDLYGCRVIDFTDEGSKFYNDELIDKIDGELKKIENLEFFVFVLSTHGEEKQEKHLRTDKRGIFQHYFYTKDGQCSTQDLMNKIANIKKLENKLKIFIIQACRSRIMAKDENEDHGIEIELEKGNDGTVHPDAKGYMLHEDEKKNKPDDKRQDNGTDFPDAGGYMPDEDEDVIQDDDVDLPDARGYMPPEDEKKNKPDDKRQNDGTDHPDAKGCMPPEDEKKNKPDDKRQNDGTDHPDAKGYMPHEDEKDKPDNKRQNDGIDLPEARGCMPPEDEKKNKPDDKRQNDGTDHPDAKGYMPHEDEKDKPDNKRQNNGIDLPEARGCMPPEDEKKNKPDDKRQNDGTDHPDAKGCMPREDEKDKPDNKRQNDGIDLPEARGCMPPEDEKKNKPDDKRQNDGTDHPDAKGCMPSEDEKDKPDNKRQNDGIDLPEDEDEGVKQPTNVASGEMGSKVENSVSELINDLPPAEGIPHCDDCVVMFASMSGKYAYSRRFTTENNGGWLIKSVDKIFQNYKKGQKAHILDILVEINREVGARDALEKGKACEIPNLDLEIQMENLQPRLKTHVNELLEICRKYSSIAEINKYQDELDKLATKIDKDGDTEDSLNIIKDETVHLTEKFIKEFHSVTVKSQSNFFHNLAFDDEDLLLCKIKES